MFVNLVRQLTMTANGLWYGIVRDYKAISCQVKPTFFLRATYHRKPLKPACSLSFVTGWHYIINLLSPYYLTGYKSLMCLI
jgi:hypothetical protein